MTHRLLVAGIGNIFLGDDGFGVYVVQRLLRRPWPEGVTVRDFGIRGFDLAYALEACDAAVLVDACQQGDPPGALSVVEPRVEDAPAATAPDPHTMTPARVLDLLRGARLPRTLRLVACEPETFGPEGLGQLGLSACVEAAVERAVPLIERLVLDLAGGAAHA